MRPLRGSIHVVSDRSFLSTLLVAHTLISRSARTEPSRFHRAVQLTKNSPRHTNRAGPRRKMSSPTRRTVWEPPGACTFTGDVARPVAMEATAEAQEPVPDD